MFKCKRNYNNIIPSDNVNNEESNSNYNTLASENDNHFYKDKKKMEDFIHEKYGRFFENFELTNYIGSGVTGIVYEGYLKRAKKKKI